MADATFNDVLEEQKRTNAILERDAMEEGKPNPKKFLKEEAVTKEQQPYFVFFENSRGIHYRSIDSLMGGQGSTSVPHIRAYKYQPKAEHREIDENISTIINWEIINSNNTLTNGADGMFASTLYTHDIYNKNLNKYSFNYIENIFKRRNSIPFIFNFKIKYFIPFLLT